MRILILGGGVAGLTACKKLLDSGFDVTVVEKSIDHGKSGHGFALLPNGLSALDSIGVLPEVREKGQLTNRFILRNTKGEVLADQKLENHLTVLRSDVVEVLLRYTQSSVQYGLDVESVTYDEFSGVKTVNFYGGLKIEADVVIGADGVNSFIRKSLFPDIKIEESRVKELVTSIYAPEIARTLGDRFIKTKNDEGGLSCGVLNAGEGKVILFCQYDRLKYKFDINDKLAVYRFMIETMGSWPTPIPELLSSAFPDHIHRWDIYARKIKGDIFRKNVVVIGDAAHTFLPLTSQGANCALVDAVKIGEALLRHPQNIRIAFEEYQRQRFKVYNHYFTEGKKLEENFVKSIEERQNLVPLVSYE